MALNGIERSTCVAHFVVGKMRPNHSVLANSTYLQKALARCPTFRFEQSWWRDDHAHVNRQRKMGSDSLLMKFKRRLALVS